MPESSNQSESRQIRLGMAVISLLLQLNAKDLMNLNMNSENIK